MVIYTVTSSYMEEYLFGSFSTILKAREAIHKFICEDGNFDHYEDVGDYRYIAYMPSGEMHFFTITADVVDSEY